MPTGHCGWVRPNVLFHVGMLILHKVHIFSWRTEIFQIYRGGNVVTQLDGSSVIIIWCILGSIQSQGTIISCDVLLLLVFLFLLCGSSYALSFDAPLMLLVLFSFHLCFILIYWMSVSLALSSLQSLNDVGNFLEVLEAVWWGLGAWGGGSTVMQR